MVYVFIASIKRRYNAFEICNSMAKLNEVAQRILFIAGIWLAIQACSNNDDRAASDARTTIFEPRDSLAGEKIPNLNPRNEKPEWGLEIKDNMQVVIDELISFNATPIERLSAEAARKNPSPADAVLEVMKENSIPVSPTQVDTMGKKIDVNEATIHLRIYTPTGVGPFPIIVYYHGGGWVIANLDTYHASAQGLSERTEAVVVSVKYRQGPEHKFPTAHNDSFAVYEWVANNAESLNGDAARIAVVGESAGGNLAANVSILAREKGITAPLHQVLIYPIADDNTESESYKKFANAKPLNKAMMMWFFDKYLPSTSLSGDPRIALVKANLKGLPPTTIINAGIDPLLSEGELLRDKLKAAGVEVDFKKYDGVTHEFFGMAAIVPEARDAQEFAARKLKDAFGTGD